MNDSVIFDLPNAEAAYLRELVEQYLELVSSAADPRDPATRRLFPDAYPDDEEASAEFRALTQDDVSATRAADARRVLATLSLESDRPPAGPAHLSLRPEEQTAWLRTLTGLRLVLADRVGITDENIMPVGDPRFDVYEWLGYRQEMLLRALDA